MQCDSLLYLPEVVDRLACWHCPSLVLATPLPAANHSARDLALSPVRPELPRRGRASRFLAGRRLDISYETVRRWVLKFGPMIARNVRQRRRRPRDHWHLDEMVVRIAGRQMYLW